MKLLRILLGFLVFAGAVVGIAYFFVRRGSKGLLPINPADYLRPLPDQAQLNGFERYVKTEKIRNARDLGGYVTADGKVVRSGTIFRTGTLGDATESDLNTLESLGIRTIWDLRSEREVTEKPDRVPSGATHTWTPIQEGDPMKDIFPKLLFERSALSPMLGDGYIQMVTTRPERFGSVLTKFADQDNLPALFHCTAGKDRAGITAALLLGLLGVPKETIIADYSLSNHAFDDLYADFEESSAADLKRFGIPLDDLKSLLVANPNWLEGVLAHIEQNHGSIESFLIEKAGMTPETLDQIRVNLLENPKV